MMGWQWRQLDHMQIICSSLQADNYASTSPFELICAEVFVVSIINTLCFILLFLRHGTDDGMETVQVTLLGRTLVASSP